MGVLRAEDQNLPPENTGLQRDGETGGATTEAQILQGNESRDIHMPRGALNTEGPKNQNPRPFAQTARDKDGVTWSLELYFLGRDSGGTRPARR